MSDIYNVYCDESCHLQHDESKVMMLGAIWCPLEKTREIAVRLREIKVDHGIKPHAEIKWSKVSPSKLDLYLALIDYFFDDDHLHYRGLIIPDKTILDHEKHLQDHDAWYYKMYFHLIEPILRPDAEYRIYLDKKDTRGGEKVHHLGEVLRNNMYDFDRSILKRDVQIVHSHEIEQVQLCDLVTGAIGYLNRGLVTSPAKIQLIERIKVRSGYKLNQTTLLRENKMNILRWKPGANHAS